jgi:molybdenum cofactor synthesis domain-containing protein
VLQAALITVSTSRARGAGADLSGERLAELAGAIGVEIAGREVIADDQGAIESRLRHWCDVARCALILTTGGTGLAPSDVTPEATAAVIERHAPGIGHAIREASRAHTANWMLSRGVAGVRGATLIVNFPGSPGSIAQVADSLAGPLAHALALIAGPPSTYHP